MITSQDCPVARLAQDAAQVLRKRAAFEGVHDDLSDAMMRRFSHLEAAAPHLRAHSAGGALFQVLVAHGLIDLLYHNCIAGFGDTEAAEQFGQINACLESAALALRGVGDEPLLDFYMTRAMEMEAIAA